MDYKITITTPKDYDGKKKCKILYYVDSWWLKETICGINALALISKNIDPIILVGISVKGDELQWHLQRNYDYTPSPYNKKLMGFTMNGGLSKLDSIHTGGANKFIEFLESKVFKFVEESYLTMEGRGFIGHSFGGLLGVHIFQTRPEIFENIILISPSTWWNRSEILTDNLFRNTESQERNTKIYLAVGKKEAKLLTKSVTKLNSILSTLIKEELRYKYELFDNANHNSVIPQAVYNGLEYMYGITND